MQDMNKTVERSNFPELVETSDAPYCSAVLDDNYAFLAGVVAADFPEGRRMLGDVGAETTAVMTVIKRELEQIGLSTAAIVRCDVHLTDLKDMPAMNAAYRVFFEDGAYPARTCTQSGALFGGSMVEITCIARRVQSKGLLE